MKILVINCGSSSLKYQVIDMQDEKVLVKGLVERIGIAGSQIKHKKTGAEPIIIQDEIKDHKQAIELVLQAITDKNHGVVASMNEIKAVGHRVLHAGEDFYKSVIIDDKVMESIKNCIDLAPLHNPANIMGIEACKALMPTTPMVAVFDTAFHQTIPPENYIYAIPYEYYTKYRVRRYGFHGTSHRYVSARAAEIMGRDINNLKIIACHLGNGASVSAIKNGKILDTSMGFTPLEGLMMGARSGDLDPAILTYIMNKENLSLDEMNNILNKKSGVLGVSGVSSDFRDIEQAIAEGNERAKLARNIFVNRVKKYIGAYIAEMNGVDAIIFTAGVGENQSKIRELICDNFDFIGLEFDKEKNKIRGQEQVISTEASKIKVLVIPTDEELMIARDAMELVK